jgi:glucose/arabinose dehydrogenase
MKKPVLIATIVMIIVVAGLGSYWYWQTHLVPNELSLESQSITGSSTPLVTAATSTSTSTSTATTTKKNVSIEIVAKDMNIPWDIAFLPEGGMLVTERPGQLVHIKSDGSKQSIIIDNVQQSGESGLLGITLHPNFTQNKMLYLYITHAEGAGLRNRVERYVFQNNVLSQKKTIISNIPGALYHDGGRMDFGPDGKLYITTGDATNEDIAQDKNSLGGKILRLNDDGTIPQDNPFGTAVYSLGHRNPQGLAWDTAGNLWETEHGRSGALSGYDEINLITPGTNYGWPTIEGDERATDLTRPSLHSGSNATWAPASAVYWDGSLFFGGLRGEALYEAKLRGTTVVSLKKYFFKEYGRIRTVRLGPDGMFYFTTSNRDNRGTIKTNDDKILKVNPARFR